MSATVHPRRKKYDRSQLAWQRKISRDLGVRLDKPTVILLLRQLYGVWLRMETLEPTTLEYQQATTAYGKIHDRLRGMAYRR
jgi:hypothetical protein